MKSRPRALILGGGLAGLAAAVRLHEANFRTTLVESKNRLGGRATSFDDPQSGKTIDNCQHVLLKCCTNLIDFYRRLDVLNQIAWHDTLYFASKSSSSPTTPLIDILKPASLIPAPLHLSLSFLKFRAFSLADKLALAKAMRAIMATDRKAVAHLTFLEYLKQHEQPPQLIKRFWEVVITSAGNLRVNEIGAQYALHIFQEGFLNHRDAFVMGLPVGALRTLYDPAARFIDDLKLGRRVVSLECDSSGKVMTAVNLDNNEQIRNCDIIIGALPASAWSRILPPALRRLTDTFAPPELLIDSPILGVHLWFNDSLSDLPHAAFLDHEIDWVFFREEGTYAHVVVSAANKWMPLNKNEIIQRTLADLHSIFPAATAENLIDGRIIKEKNATFAPTPNTHALRPGNTTPISNLFLAGDFTHTGWPATMEGAVRSGYLAAHAATQYMAENENPPTQEHKQPPTLHNPLAPNLKPTYLYRIIQQIPFLG